MFLNRNIEKCNSLLRIINDKIHSLNPEILNKVYKNSITLD